MVLQWIKNVTLLAVVSVGLVWGGAAHAIPISGTFSLYNDAAGHDFEPNQLLASARFRTAAENRRGSFRIDGVRHATVNIVDMVITDQTGGLLPDFNLLGDPDTTIPSRLFAILDNDDPSRILGFNGRLQKSGGRPNATITFLGPRPGTNPADGIVATFRVAGRNDINGRFDESGVQRIPEPTSIALLGAGLVAFGVSARRRTVRLTAA